MLTGVAKRRHVWHISILDAIYSSPHVLSVLSPSWMERGVIAEETRVLNEPVLSTWSMGTRQHEANQYGGNYHWRSTTASRVRFCMWTCGQRRQGNGQARKPTHIPDDKLCHSIHSSSWYSSLFYFFYQMTRIVGLSLSPGRAGCVRNARFWALGWLYIETDQCTA